MANNQYLEAAKQIVAFVGGENNVIRVASCATRLRVVVKDDKHSWCYFFINSFKDKFILILVVLAIINKFVGDDTLGTVIILAIGFVSAMIKFAQNYSTYKFNRKLKSEMFSTATVVRNGKEQTIRTEKVVKGDIIHLNAGSIIPADVMIIENKDLFLNQSVFTGESAPIEKTDKFNNSNEIFSISNILHIVLYPELSMFGLAVRWLTLCMES